MDYSILLDESEGKVADHVKRLDFGVAPILAPLTPFALAVDKLNLAQPPSLRHFI